MVVFQSEGFSRKLSVGLLFGRSRFLSLRNLTKDISMTLPKSKIPVCLNFSANNLFRSPLVLNCCTPALQLFLQFRTLEGLREESAVLCPFCSSYSLRRLAVSLSRYNIFISKCSLCNRLFYFLN